MTCLKTLFSVICLMTLSGELSADGMPTIADELNDSTSITVIQPEKLNMRLSTVAGGLQQVGETTQSETQQPARQTGKTAGYRVQVFSDNNPRTSKNEARSKERSLSAAFPQYSTYVTYNSPYWRLKVGDFTTLSEAEAAADEIKKQFPSFAREIRVVHDRINLFK